MTAGVYAIIDRDGKPYIGMSIVIEMRFDYHKGRLMRGQHHCVPLQHAWNSDKPDNIHKWQWRILEILPVDAPSVVFQERERYWIKHFATGAYNTAGTKGKVNGY